MSVPSTRRVSPAPPEAGGWLRRLMPFLWAHKYKVFVAFGAAAAGQAIAGLTPAAEKIIMDDSILSHRRSMAPWLTLLVLAGVARFITAAVRRYVGGRVALDVQYDLRMAIYDRLQRLDFARHDEMQTGQLVSRASSDVGLLQGILGFLPIMSGNVVLLVTSLVVMLLLSPLLTLVSLTVVPLVLLVTLKMRSTVFPASWDSQQRTAEVAGIVDEAVTGVRVVKGFGQEQRELDRLTDKSGSLFASRMRAVRLQAKYTSTLSALPALGQVGILALGGWLALHHRISLGTFLAFSTYLVQLVAPVRTFAILVFMGQMARAGGERILDLLDSNPTVVEREDAEVLPPVRGELTFEGVNFGYLRSEPVLRGFDLAVSPGEVVALVGASGSGKSTVSLLLPRFYDVQEGAVTVDGVDVRDVTFESLRRQIGVVFEESFLFSESVRANISYGRPDATEAEIITAAKAAEAHEFIMALPEGYDTVVGERGLTLSGGQRQRISLARAIITDPRVLVLDDATSSVDARIEEEIHSTLRRVMVGRTTVLIAHRRSTLRLADRIIVVDQGRVVDDGSHEELLARSDLYRELLAGPGEDCEGKDVEPATVVSGGGITASAWQPVDAEGNGRVAAMTSGGPGPGPGPARPVMAGGAMAARGGFGGGGGWGAAMAPTPELLAKVESLPPATDVPNVDVARESAHDPTFTLRKFTLPFRFPLYVGLCLVVLDTLATLAGPLFVRTGIDRGVRHGSQHALMVMSLGYLGVTLADWLDSYVMTRYTGRTAERMLFGLRVRIFSHLQRLSLDYYDREMAGRVMTRMTTDVEALSTLLQTGLITAIVNILTFGGVAVLLIVMNWRLSIPTLTVVPPLLVATIWFRRRSDKAYNQARDRIAAVNANFQESLSGVRVSQAYVRERRNIQGFRTVANDYLDARLGAQKLVAIYFPFVEFLSEVAAAVVLGYAAHLVAAGTLGAGQVIAFLLYLDLLFSPIQQLSQVFDTYQQARASMGKIDELMAIESMTPAAVTPLVPGRLRGAIEFDDVHFKYATGMSEALSGVNLRIEPGETVALVGETGAGKSTIVKLIARFYDATGGRVLIDGMPITDLDLGAFRRQLGYVPQEAFLFSGTLRDNIAYGRPDASEAEVEEAARAVGAHDFIAALPGGYLSVVNERGRSLSAGQRQLIALARARLVDPRILLLDEATSNLDLSTEAKVQRAMNVVSHGRTTVLIAHRLQTAMSADRILVVDDGGIVEQGSHVELLARGGRYAQMWQAFSVEAQPA